MSPGPLIECLCAGSAFIVSPESLLDKFLMRGEIRRFKGCRGDGNKTFFASSSAACHLKRGQSDVNSEPRRGLLGGGKSRRRIIHTLTSPLTLRVSADAFMWHFMATAGRLCDTNKLLRAGIKIATLNLAFADGRCQVGAA